jgi:hypothetical protein
VPAEIVTAVYKSKPGQEPALRDLLRKHVVALRGSGLVTPRPRVLLRGQNGIYVEIFEWKDGAASADAAHGHPDIGGVWKAMGTVCDFTCLAELKESTQQFAHFTPVDDLGQ